MSDLPEPPKEVPDSQTFETKAEEETAFSQSAPRVSGFTRAATSPALVVQPGENALPQRRSKIAMGSSGKTVPVLRKLGTSGDNPVGVEGTSAPEASPKFPRSATIDIGQTSWTKPSARDATTPRKLFGNSGENKLNLAISPPERTLADIEQQSQSPQSPKVQTSRSATIDVGQSQIFTKPIKVARSHRAPQYTFVSSVLEQDEKNREYLTAKELKEAAKEATKEVPKEKEKKSKKADKNIEEKPPVVSLLNPPLIPSPHPPGSIALRRALSEENLKKKFVSSSPDTRDSSSLKRLTKDMSDVSNVDHATSVIVPAGSFVIVFPGGLKKSWVLDPQRALLPVMAEQCELRNLDITKVVYQNFEGAPLKLTPTTKMVDIPNSFFYVLNEHEVEDD